MILVYIDESGINQGVNSVKFWDDGPYVIWSAILIPEEKYFHLERLFCSLARKYLKVKNWQKVELHATDIWGRRGHFSRISDDDIKNYFEELFQLLTKLDMKIVVSLQQKNSRLWGQGSKRREKEKSIYAFLHGLEYQLSTLNETGVLIADSPSQNTEQFTDMARLLSDRVRWRNNPGARQIFKFRSKFSFETMSCFILDQVNYTDSKKSLFIQLEDSICFTLMRVFTYLYLKKKPRKNIIADSSKVPISVDTFNFFCTHVAPIFTFFDEKIDDVIVDRLSDLHLLGGGNGKEYLYDMEISGFTPYK